jgi:hypothetical protein
MTNRKFRGKLQNSRQHLLGSSFHSVGKENNNEMFIMVAWHKNKNLKLSAQPKPVTVVPQRRLASRARPWSASQVPNFPFNLSFMLSQMGN